MLDCKATRAKEVPAKHRPNWDLSATGILLNPAAWLRIDFASIDVTQSKRTPAAFARDGSSQKT